MHARLIDLYWRRAMARRYIPRFGYYFHLGYEAMFFALKVQHNLAQGSALGDHVPAICAL